MARNDRVKVATPRSRFMRLQASQVRSVSVRELVQVLQVHPSQVVRIRRR